METSSARLTAGMISRGRPENLDFFFFNPDLGKPGAGIWGIHYKSLSKRRLWCDLLFKSALVDYGEYI